MVGIGKTPLDRCIDRLVAAEEPKLITHQVLAILASKAEREVRLGGVRVTKASCRWGRRC